MYGWVAKLSNGKEINEQDLFVPKELSPWLKLVTKIVNEKIKIEDLYLNVGNKIINVPEEHKSKAYKYWVYRRQAGDVLKGRILSRLIGLSYVVGDIRYIIWHDEVNDNEKVEQLTLDSDLEVVPNQFYKNYQYV